MDQNIGSGKWSGREVTLMSGDQWTAITPEEVFQPLQIIVMEIVQCEDGRKIDQLSLIHANLNRTALIGTLCSGQLSTINAGTGYRMKECAFAAVGLTDQRNTQAVPAMVERAG
jgi:hypothetical protein